jgi:hypothetical protein
MSHEDDRVEPEWDSGADEPEPAPRSEPAPPPQRSPAPAARAEPTSEPRAEPALAAASPAPTFATARIFQLPAAPRAQPAAEAPAVPVMPVDEAIRRSFFAGVTEAEDQEKFDLPGAEKVGIIGGRQVGKSYLFQSMVYRTYAGNQSGALTYFLEDGAIRLFSALKRKDRASSVNLANFVRNYETWKRLPSTYYDEQRWYRLRLPFRTGWLGTRRSALDVEYFDGSGESFFEAVRRAENTEIWRQGYLDARVMVFCLPLWTAFPGPGMTEEDWAWRDRTIEGFEKVVENYLDVRGLDKGSRCTATILALTMADDSRSALTTLRQRWIEPYLQAPHVYIKQLRRGSGMATYLANARKISQALEDEFQGSRDPKVAAIPKRLNLGAGKPWLVPVSAIDGAFLDRFNRQYPDGTPRPRLPAPVPIHVELPLLVALAERDNALM